MLTAESAQETMAVLEKEAVDVIISDENMPGISGTDLLRVVKERYPAVVKIMVTGASDIHIEPKTGCTLIRYRIDGLLQEPLTIPARQHLATISRLKILAKMDIAERRIPPDGRISVRSGDKLVDIRVSSMPTISGEKNDVIRAVAEWVDPDRGKRCRKARSVVMEEAIERLVELLNGRRCRTWGTAGAHLRRVVTN